MDTMNDSVFRRIYAEKKDLVFRMALKYVDHDADIAEEIMQDVFEKLYFNCDHENEEYITGWMFKTTKNMIIDYRRRKDLEPISCDITTCEMHDEAPSAEDIVLAKEKAEECRKLSDDILDGLYSVNPRWYEAVILCHVFEMERKDVAKEMGISMSALYSMMIRAEMWINKNFGEKKNKLLKD